MPPKIRYFGFVHVDPSSGPLRLSKGWNLFGGVWDLKTNQLARAFDFTMPEPQKSVFKIAALVDLAGDLEELFAAPKGEACLALLDAGLPSDDVQRHLRVGEAHEGLVRRFEDLPRPLFTSFASLAFAFGVEEFTHECG